MDIGLQNKVAITGATGKLGNFVVKHLLKKLPANQIVAVVRNMEKAAPLAGLGVEVRYGNYMDQASLVKAFSGVSKLLLISSSDAFDETLRMVQHANVVRAAKSADVGHICYTGTAFTEDATFDPALLHLASEYAIRASRLNYTFLRDTLYTEVFIGPDLVKAMDSGIIITNTNNGKINSVARADLALAHATVLAQDGHENKTYNLVSNQPWTYDELAQILSDIARKKVVHKSGSPDEAKDYLIKSGFTEPNAARIIVRYNQVATGEWAKESDDLRMLIGKETPLEETVKHALNM
jgi:NAD(P)H dehydrogenase (quinone)